jgi:hypothetical protein
MTNISQTTQQIQEVSTFQDLVSTPFQGTINAICWKRDLTGDFSEIVEKVELNENMTVIDEEELRELQLSAQGQLARDILLADMKLLKAHGADPILNVINYYERDNSSPFFPTDVYSFHVDRSPVPTNTFLCTYVGASSDILPNAQATQKILVPEIRAELKKGYHGPDDDFEAFLSEQFFDLHYQPNPNAQLINCGIGHLWRLAVDHPGSQVLPCLHRAPKENPGEKRLLLIC